MFSARPARETRLKYCETGSRSKRKRGEPAKSLVRRIARESQRPCLTEFPGRCRQRLRDFSLRKASRIGFDWEDSAGVVAKMQEETAELETALKGGGQRQIEEEMGDLLFAAVNLARFLDVDPEIALKKANRK